jgi:signal transduction histidine kinase
MTRKSLRGRLTLQFAVILTALYVAMSFVLVWNAHRTANQNASRILDAAAARTRLDLREGGIQTVMGESPEEMRADGLGLIIINSRNERRFRSQRHVPKWPRSQDGWKTVTIPFEDNKVVIGFPWWKTEESLQKLNIILLIQALFVPFFGYFGAGLLVGRILTPIAQLSKQASSAQGDNLRVELQAPTADAEVVGLVATLNGLLGRHAETVASRGRFYAAASHELRTPLQALSGHLEVALSKSRSAEGYQSALEEAHAQTQRLTELVQDLLFLNQVDVRTRCLPKEPSNLGEICDVQLTRFAPSIKERGLLLVKQIPSDVEVMAPSNHAWMLVRNLIENAVKYCSSGGKVTVEMEDNGRGPILSIYNDCAPLSSQECDQLFEPFYRPDAARNSKTGGNGLGLAICKAISSANKWPINLLQETNGLRVTVKFEESAQNAS